MSTDEVRQEVAFGMYVHTIECHHEGCDKWPVAVFEIVEDYDCSELVYTCFEHYDEYRHAINVESERNMPMPLRGSHMAPVFVIGVYEASRSYGGPEEGGWWYDTGDLEQTFFCETEGDAIRLLDFLRKQYPRTGKRSSVNGGLDYEIEVYKGIMPPEHYPERRPHYA